VTRPAILLLLGLLVLVPLSLLAGKVWIDPFDPATRNAAVILSELRLRRAVVAVTLGAGLGAAGAAMQGYLRNPLADPGLFGIAPSAALGAVLSLWLGLTAVWALPSFALVGAGGAMALLGIIAGREGGVALFTLAGMMIASLAGALMSLAISLAPTPFAMSEIVTWLMGALADRSWREVWIAAPLTLAGLFVLAFAGRGLDALTLGEAAARSLGVEPRRLQALIIAGVGLTVGSAVAVAGIIGFVGLMVPHFVRPFTDRRPSSLLVPSALAGALLLLVADCLCRVLPTVSELRLGIALSLIGAPFFLHLLLKLRSSAVWA
jgi:iron complex transport system permease protein